MMTKASIKNAIMASFVCTGFLFNGIDPGIAAVDAVPKLDIRPSCESPARHLVAIDRSIGACIRSEREAHSLLTKSWREYSKADKRHCVGVVTQGGAPSYVELHTCLRTMEHAREIRHGLHKPIEEFHRAKSAVH
jgi:hypothetical protein